MNLNDFINCPICQFELDYRGGMLTQKICNALPYYDWKHFSVWIADNENGSIHYAIKNYELYIRYDENKTYIHEFNDFDKKLLIELDDCINIDDFYNISDIEKTINLLLTFQ